jgi:hypothetical protein
MADKSGKELELLVAKIQRSLAPKAKVTHDARLAGRKSQRQRQIDVLVEDKIGHYGIMIVIDCKDYSRPVDVKGVEEFWGLVDDVGAHKGALVCPKGFTQGAKERALGYQIDLYSPIDSDPHEWQVKATLPALCDFREALVSFGITHSAPMPFLMPPDFFNNTVVHDENKNPVGTILQTSLKKWNEGRYPTDPGLHKDLKIFECEKTFVDSGYSQLTPIDLTASVIVKSMTFFGQVPVSKISGFKDEQTGGLITNAFTVGLVKPEEVEKTWLRVNKGDPLPAKPVLEITGLVGYADD